MWKSQIIEAKARKALQQPHNLFLSMLKGMRTWLLLEMWLTISSMKNYNPLRTALKTKHWLHKLPQKLYPKF